jgi:hypothetical protein
MRLTPLLLSLTLILACGESTTGSQPGPETGAQGGTCYGNLSCNVGLACVESTCIFLDEGDVSQGPEEDASSQDVAVDTLDVLGDAAAPIEDTTHKDSGHVADTGTDADATPDCAPDCAPDCVNKVQASCKAILEAGLSAGDGTYVIDPDDDGPIEAFQVECDMTTDGGGWTGVSFASAHTRLGGVMEAVVACEIAGIDAKLGPYTRDGEGAHAYHYTFEFGPGWNQFYLGEDYKIASNACPDPEQCTVDIYSCWHQTLWSQGFTKDCASTGDVSFGDAAMEGPVTSLSKVAADDESWNKSEAITWPAGTEIYEVPTPSSLFRIGWGESGAQSEGWYPWYQGTIYLR